MGEGPLKSATHSLSHLPVLRFLDMNSLGRASSLPCGPLGLPSPPETKPLLFMECSLGTGHFADTINTGRRTQAWEVDPAPTPSPALSG